MFNFNKTVLKTLNSFYIKFHPNIIEDCYLDMFLLVSQMLIKLR